MVSSRVGMSGGESVVAVVADAEVAGPALFAGEIFAAAAAVAADAEYLPNLRMVDCFPFVAVGLGGSILGLVQNSWAFVAADLQRMGWRASGPWSFGRVVT
jgi:hypothetical protein